MNKNITIKDVPKEKVVFLTDKNFSETKALGLVGKILIWLQEKGVGVSGLPLTVLNQDKTFEVCVPVKENIKKEREFKIKHLPAHRMGSILHKEPEKPLSLSEGFLERQLKYEGITLLEPRRYIFHQNPEKPDMPIVEIQIPIHK